MFLQFALTSEQFSIECYKTKTNVIILANHCRRKQQNEAISCERRQALENTCKQGAIGFVWKSGASFLNQSQSKKTKGNANSPVSRSPRPLNKNTEDTFLLDSLNLSQIVLKYQLKRAKT